MGFRRRRRYYTPTPAELDRQNTVLVLAVLIPLLLLGAAAMGKTQTYTVEPSIPLERAK